MKPMIVLTIFILTGCEAMYRADQISYCQYGIKQACEDFVRAHESKKEEQRK